MACKFTRLGGIPVQPRAKEKLKYLYDKILRVSDKLPLDYPYRISMEKIICHNLSILNECDERPYKLEERLNGKFEIMIHRAEAEFTLISKLLEYKPWEPLIQPPPDQWVWPPIIK